MSLSEVGTGAGEAAFRAEMPRPRFPVVPSRSVAPGGRHRDDALLLDRVRRGLAPADPVALLLASWPAPPARPVAVVRRDPL